MIPMDNRQDDKEELASKIIGQLLFFIPMALILAALYWGGAVAGGFLAGMANVVISLITIFIWYLVKKNKHH